MSTPSAPASQVAWPRGALCRKAADRCGGTSKRAGASRRSSAFSGRAESGSPGAGVGTLQYSSFAILVLSIYHASALRRALSVGPAARISRPAGELRPKLLCTVVGNGQSALVLACHRLPYKAAPAESNDGTAMIEDGPGFPIFWILPEKHAGWILTGTLVLRIATSTRSQDERPGLSSLFTSGSRGARNACRPRLLISRVRLPERASVWLGDGSFIAVAEMLSCGFKRKSFDHRRHGTTRKRIRFCMPKRETFLAWGHCWS